MVEPLRRLRSVIDTIRRLLARRASALPPRASRILFLAAAALVAGLAYASWRSAGLSFRELEWWALLVALGVAAPLSLWLRAIEFDVSARILGHRPTAGRSLRVALAASAANLLPIPGSLLVNANALSRDSSYGPAIGASAVPGIIWVGIVGVVGGVAVVIGGAIVFGVVLLVGGVGVFAAGWLLFMRTAVPEGRLALAGRILAVEFGYVGISILRLSLALAALDVSASLDQVIALSVAGALTAAIGIFPAGLGIREVLVGALAPLVGLPFAVGVLVGVTDRLVWLTFLGLVMAVAAAFPASSSEV